MIYLIGQLAIWLLLTAASAALAGWAYAAEKSAAAEESRRRERENLLRDLVRHTGDGADALEPEHEGEPSGRLLSIRDARIVELERALETARGRADQLGGEVAELQRRGEVNPPDADELARLRALESERTRTVDAEATPVEEDENVALQMWRLRYFEQRVRYLESQARMNAAAQAPQVNFVEPAPEASPGLNWAAREAHARAAFLEGELRALRQASSTSEPAAPAGEAQPFAANADVDVLLRWRMLYLERRVAHLQRAAAAALPAPSEIAPDPDRWRWRARYLEARVRHLEQRAPAPVDAQAVTAPIMEEAEPAQPRAVTPNRRAKPPVLASARNGASDDFTLIEGVSLLQQTTLYALGVFHFDQIAAWTGEHVAWVDQYLRLQGRIEAEEWVEQAAELAREGPAAARRMLADEDA